VADLDGQLKEDNISRLKSISEAVQKGWKEKYMKKKYKAPKWFNSRKVTKRRPAGLIKNASQTRVWMK
jgi:hypothetical protein